MRTGRSFIYVDVSSSSTVVTCAVCPHWYGFGDDRLDGLRVAARHEANVHPSESTAARNRLSTYEARHAG